MARRSSSSRPPERRTRTDPSTSTSTVGGLIMGGSDKVEQWASERPAALDGGPGPSTTGCRPTFPIRQLSTTGRYLPRRSTFVGQTGHRGRSIGGWQPRCRIDPPSPRRRSSTAGGRHPPDAGMDLTESGDSFRTNLGLDSVLTGSLMPADLLYTAGHDLAHPYLSPLFGDFAGGFPPTFLTTETRDLFLSNTVRMHRALRAADVPTELHVMEAAPHGRFFGTRPKTPRSRVICGDSWSCTYLPPSRRTHFVLSFSRRHRSLPSTPVVASASPPRISGLLGDRYPSTRG